MTLRKLEAMLSYFEIRTTLMQPSMTMHQRARFTASFPKTRMFYSWKRSRICVALRSPVMVWRKGRWMSVLVWLERDRRLTKRTMWCVRNVDGAMIMRATKFCCAMVPAVQPRFTRGACPSPCLKCQMGIGCALVAARRRWAWSGVVDASAKARFAHV